MNDVNEEGSDDETDATAAEDDGDVAMAEPDDGSDASDSDSNDEDGWGSDDDLQQQVLPTSVVIGLNAIGIRLYIQCSL